MCYAVLIVNQLRVVLTSLASLAAMALLVACSQDSGSEVAEFAHDTYRTRVATEPGCA